MIYASQAHGVGNGKETEYLEGWQRARAELDNFRKRVAAQQEVGRQQARASALASFLSLADNFQAIMKHIPSELESHTWAAGVKHVARQFEQILGAQGVAPIVEIGIPFNPVVHEAVEEVKQAETKSGVVLEIIQPGYLLGDKVLKPARVKISA